MKTITTFIKRGDVKWRPWCVSWSQSTGDLLVGMYIRKPMTGKVVRYNQNGQLTQTIQRDNIGQELFSKPIYIIENTNGDVVVSNCKLFRSGSVVVTGREGRYRFSYTGHPSELGLWPSGVCTDALSHILVCDDKTKTVHMIDKDGQFLSYLLTESQKLGKPYCLGYDINTHRLWVGSNTNKVVVYSYIDRQGAMTDCYSTTNDEMNSLCQIQTKRTEIPLEGNNGLLKLVTPPKLVHSPTVTGVVGSHHISCLPLDRVWVSDGNSLIWTNTTGVTLLHLENLCSGLNNGVHTINGESRLIYIDRKYNINKLSEDMKTAATFIERTDFTWRPRCVYWSKSTGDLLVGMCYTYTNTGKVTRFNQTGQLTQTIKHDNSGLQLYRKPIFVTENTNGDVVVSDFAYNSGAVVVTEREGRHRFSYTGYSSGSGLQPQGICIDALSHILLCDGITNMVHMLDRDGQFLSHLLTESQKLFGKPYSLSYDINTNLLWIGSDKNSKLCVYRFITRREDLTDKPTPCPHEDVLSYSRQGGEGR